MDYSVGELDYETMDEEIELPVVQPTHDLIDLTGDDDDDELMIIDSPGEDGGSVRAITPEPQDSVGLSCPERRDCLRTSPAESTGDSGIESSPGDDPMHNTTPSIGRSRPTTPSPSSERRSLSPDFGAPPVTRRETRPPETAIVPVQKLCRLAYHDIPGYPRLQRTYKFLRPDGRIPARHQLLHMCHTGTEQELLPRLQHIIDTFDYQKVVIFARRTERLRDIKVTLKRKCGLDSLFLGGDTEPEKVEKVCDWFAQMRRRALICSSQILPSSRSLEGVNLVFWWNIPYSMEEFITITSRIATAALLVVVLKQEEDWEFLHLLREKAEVIFPEMDVDSSDPAVAGFINATVHSDEM